MTRYPWQVYLLAAVFFLGVVTATWAFNRVNGRR